MNTVPQLSSPTEQRGLSHLSIVAHKKYLQKKGFPLVTDCSCEDTWLITAPRRQEMGSVFIEDVDTFIFKLFDINLNYCYYDLVYHFL